MKKIEIGQYYLAINLLKRFRYRKLELISYDENLIFYGKRLGLEILIYDIRSTNPSQILCLSLYDQRWRLIDDRLVQLSQKETAIFAAIFKALDDEAKKQKI